MNIFKNFKIGVNKVDDFREDVLEERLSAVLKTLDANVSLQELEEKLLREGMKYLAETYGSKYGDVSAVPDEAYSKTAKVIISVKSKINRKLQKQLNKKSKAYLKRHNA